MRSLLLIATAMVVHAAALADEPKNLAFDTKLERIVVFKEGFGFYIRQGQARLENGWATTSLAPAAVNGTFWVFPTAKADRIEQLVATRDNTIPFKKPEEIRPALEDKIGLRLSVTANDKENIGKLSGLLPNMLLLEENKQFTAVSYDTVQSIKLVGYPLRIKLKTPNPTGPAGFVFGYVQDGVRWEPGYLLQVGDGGKATLTMRATLLGIPEKVENVTVQFVVGAPMISERGRIETLLRALAAVTGRTMELDAGMMNQVRDEMARRSPGGAGGRPAPAEDYEGAPIQLGGEESGELFYYTAEGISMGPSDVASITIFEHAVSVEPRFEWQADTDTLTYILQVKNETGLPLTTGPAFVLGDEKPLGQGLIRYTPNGATSEVRLASGVGIRTSVSEVEVSRGEPFVVNGRRRVTVQMKGSLELENFRSEAAKVKILRTVKGKMLSVGDGGTVKTTSLVRDGSEPTNTLEWWVDVKPGEKRAVTYTYEVTILADMG